MSLIKNIDFLDIHYHVNPDAFMRRYSALQAGRIYRKLGGGVVLKNHLGSCVNMAYVAQSEGFPVFGSLVLNPIAGRPWRKIIEQSLCMNQDSELRLLVHFPTFIETNHKSKLKRTINNIYIERYGFDTESVLTESGKLTAETRDVLLMAKDHPIVISTGHANKKGIFALIEEALRIGLDRLMLNQPASPMTGLTAYELLDLSINDFIYFEQTALTYILRYQEFEDLHYVLKTIPNAIYSSDLGQKDQMDIEEWLSTANKMFRRINLGLSRVKDLMLNNPIKLLRI